MIQPQTMRMRIAERLTAIRKLSRYAFQTMIAPWPLFGVVLALLALIGSLTPFAQIKVTTLIVDRLTTLAPATPSASLSLDLLVGVLRPILPWLAVLIAARTVGALIATQTFQRYLAAQMNERVQERLHLSLFRKALGMRLEMFERPSYHDTLQLARRVSQSGRTVDELVNMQLLVVVLISSVSVLILLGSVHWAIPVALLLGNLLVNYAFMRLVWRITKRNDVLNSLIRRGNYWRNLATRRETAAEVRLFQIGDHLVSGWHKQFDQFHTLVGRAREETVARLMPSYAFESLLYGGVGLVLFNALRSGAITAGTFVALFYALLQVRGNLLWTIRVLLNQSQRFYADLWHSMTFMHLPGDQPAGTRPAPATIQSGVRFESVCFQYPEAKQPTLIDINLHIRPGERLALVGENGAGKSTLVKLLLGLYQPTSGRITIDGIDLAAIDLATWRTHVGAVFQDYMRYAVTARENIGFGRLDRLDQHDAIVKAARMSGADSMIEALSDGYDTLLGKEFAGGQDISQGQWQMLAIARAYLRDADILVLDEPAAALDAITEREVYRQFLALSQDKTMLLISHRIGSARLADRIVALEHGRIVQEGDHATLVAAEGVYAELYKLQAAWYQAEEVPHAKQAVA